MSQFRVAHDPFSIFSGMSHAFINTYISKMELAVFPPLKYVLSCLNKSQLNKPQAWSLLQLIHRESLSVGRLAYLSSFLPWATSYGFKHPPPRRTEVPKAEKARETPKIQKIWKIRRSTRSSHEVLKTLYLFGRCLYHSTWAEVRGQLEGIGSLLPPHHTGLEDSILVFRLRSTSLTPWAISLTCFHEMENAVGSCRRVPTLAELHTAGHRLLGVQVCESSLTPGRAFQWHRSLLVTQCVYKKPQ